MPRPPFLLAIDVGNTAASCGLFPLDLRLKHALPSSSWTIGTSQLIGGTLFRKAVITHFKRHRITHEQVKDVIISSVVPPVDASLRRQSRALFHCSPHFVSAKTAFRVKVLYRNPGEVGADRLVNARAAMELHRGPCIVIDFGTATTFDCISARGEYLGGVISPGPVISAEALYQKTAKLPLAVLERPAKILGRNTLESIQSGLYHGYRGLVKEIVLQLKKKLGARTKVLATGGQARWILQGLPIVDYYYPALTLSGLYLLWRDISGSH